MWKWLDKEGNVQYSDLPPPLDTPPDKILKRGDGRSLNVPLTDGGAASVPSLVKQLEEKKKAEEAKKKAEEDAKRKEIEAKNAKIRASNCEEAKRVLNTINASGGRLATTNDKGERIFLDDKQIVERRKQTEQAVSSNCNPLPPEPATPAPANPTPPAQP